jgi:hypothetical protein
MTWNAMTSPQKCAVSSNAVVFPKRRNVWPVLRLNIGAGSLKTEAAELALMEHGLVLFKIEFRHC